MTTAQDQQSRAELLPCPFCGSESVIMEQYKSDGLRIICKNCAVKREQRTIRQSIDWLREGMISDWNRRAPADQAARALPAGMEPVGYWHQGPTDDESDFHLHADTGDVSCEKCITLYTAAQVLAMGRVPDELTDADLSAIYKQANGEDVGKAHPLTTANIFRAMRATLAAAPRPPAAKEASDAA